MILNNETVVLLPVSLFALLHSASYSLQLLDVSFSVYLYYNVTLNF